MSKTAPASTSTGFAARFRAFVLEQFPFALQLAADALADVGAIDLRTPTDIEHVRVSALARVQRALDEIDLRNLPAPTPGVSASDRFSAARDALIGACDGFFQREIIAPSLTADERREILRGMVLTRAVDNRLKHFFSNAEVRYKGTPFQGKGFRSLGQEAIYAAAIRLRRGAANQTVDGWRGD